MMACASASPREIHVRPDERVPFSPTGAVLVYEANVCALSVRARATGKEFRRFVPDAGWEIQNSGRASVLMTALPLEPGHYRVTALFEADSWRETDDGGPAYGYTGCRNRGLDERRVDIPFAVEKDRITLLAVPEGPLDFVGLDRARLAMGDPSVTDAIGGWFAAIRDAIRARHAELVASRREAHEGYDVYRDCDGKTAVVRTTGSPFPFVADPDNAGLRDEFRGRALAGFRRVHSVHAHGFGAACTGGYSFAVMMYDASELERAIEGVGAWLVQNDLRGEIDIIIAGIPHEQ